MILWGPATDTLAPQKAYIAVSPISCLQNGRERNHTLCSSHRIHCARIYMEAKLSCCFLSNPVTLCLEVFFPPAQAHSLHIKVCMYVRVHIRTHARTHSVRPQTWNFYNEQDTEKLKATGIQPPSVPLSAHIRDTGPSFHQQANQ